MSRFIRRAAAVAALVAAPVIAFAGPAFASSSTTTTTTAQVNAAQVGYENEVVRLTNVQRVQHGCGALHIDQRLVTAARGHSTDMVQAGYFDHAGSDGSSFVDREVAAGYPQRAASAENIAWGFRTPSDVVTAWMHSPGHRRNILNCSSQAVGVGLAYGAGGAAYWTQDFGRS